MNSVTFFFFLDLKKICCCFVQSLSPVQLFVTPWTAACQTSLSSLSLGVCSNSCPSGLWYHPTISSSTIPFSYRLQSFPASGSFPMNHVCIRWPKYWSFSFSISPSNEYSGLISFMTDWFDLLAVQSLFLFFFQSSHLWPKYWNIWQSL